MEVGSVSQQCSRVDVCHWEIIRKKMAGNKYSCLWLYSEVLWENNG